MWDPGKCIRVERERRGWSQTKLGKLCGYSQKTISKIERGAQRGATRIVEVARALGLNPHYVRTGKGPKVAGPQSPDLARLLGTIASLDPDKQRTIRAYLDVQVPGWDDDDDGPVSDTNIPGEDK